MHGTKRPTPAYIDHRGVASNRSIHVGVLRLFAATVQKSRALGRANELPKGSKREKRPCTHLVEMT
jgi:hypothetical protein